MSQQIIFPPPIPPRLKKWLTNTGLLTALGGAGGGSAYSSLLLASGPLAIWPMNELTGSVADDAASPSPARDGAYSNVTLNADTFAKGGASGSWNGTTSFMNSYSASLAAVFGQNLGTILIWGKVANVGVWADGITRLLLRMGADATNNLIQLDKLGATGALRMIYISGGVPQVVAVVVTPVIWFSVAITWNKASDRVRGYYNGVQQGIDMPGLGVWAGALATTLCTVGSASTTPANVWSGGLAYATVWNRELTAAEILALSV